MVNPSESFILLPMTRSYFNTHLPGNALGIDIDGQSYFARFHQLTNSDLAWGTSLKSIYPRVLAVFLHGWDMTDSRKELRSLSFLQEICD